MFETGCVFGRRWRTLLSCCISGCTKLNTKSLSPNLSDVFEEQQSCYNTALPGGIVCVLLCVYCFWPHLSISDTECCCPQITGRGIVWIKMKSVLRNDSNSLYTPITYTVMKEQFVFFCFSIITEQRTFRRVTVLAASSNKLSVLWDIFQGPATIHRVHTVRGKQ